MRGQVNANYSANYQKFVDFALDGDFGEDIVSFNGEFNADEINAAEILDDLLAAVRI